MTMGSFTVPNNLPHDFENITFTKPVSQFNVAIGIGISHSSAKLLFLLFFLSSKT
jgi:hypothetical protein